MSNKSSISSKVCGAYAAPHMTTVWLIAPIGIVQGIYAKHYGISLTAIAAVLFAARLFDAVTDPLVGYLTDRFHKRFHTRKPIILVGGVLFIISGYFVYVPPAQVSTDYLLIWLLAIYLAWTLFEVPHLAWASELAPSGTDKTKIFCYRHVADYMGVAFFYCIPLLPFFATSEITPVTLKISVIIASISMLLLLFLSLKTVPDNPDYLQRKPSVGFASMGKVNLSRSQQCDLPATRIIYQSLIKNRPLAILLAGYVLIGLANGMWFGLIYIFVDAYLGMGNQFSQMFLLAYLIGMMATPGWSKVALTIGKKKAWAIAVALMILSFIYTGTLERGQVEFFDLLFLKVLQTLGFACVGVVVPALLSEIADYCELKSGQVTSATLFSLYIFSAKASQSVAIALGLAIAGWYGFDVVAEVHSQSSVRGLMMAISWIPIALSCIALFFILWTPIDARRHEIVRHRLDLREVRTRRAATVKVNP